MKKLKNNPSSTLTELRSWIKTESKLPTDILQGDIETTNNEIYIQKPIPGGDKWLSVDLDKGTLLYSHSDRGWIAWLNDLHKGRNTHGSWNWFIDIFAIATLVFCITGLILLYIHSKRRPATWYITAAGLVIPVIIINLFTKLSL